MPHVNQVDSDESFGSVVEEEVDPNALVSPRRPHQSPTASPAALLVPDPPPTLEVLEAAGRSLRNLPNNPHRQALQARQAAAAAAAAANAEAQAPVVAMPDNVILAFEDEDGVDEAGALREACRNVEKVEWDDNDVAFFFSKVEIKMSAVGVKKQYTKFQVLSTVLPKKVEDQLKSLLIKTETDYPEKNAYKLLKTEVLRIFGPKPERAVERALSRVLVDTPSHLARDLVNDLCRSPAGPLNCPCCPAIVSCLWKRQLGSQVRAGIAHCKINHDTFNAVVQLADDIHSTAHPGPVVAKVSLDETQPGLEYPVPEVAAVRGRGFGGRGGRGRGPRNRGGRGQSSGTGQSNNSPATQTTARQYRGPKHPDLPSGPWSGCQMHHRWGKAAFFCSEPSTCPWKDVFIAKPTK